MRAAVAGASGLVGGECLKLLLENARYARVLALVRRPLGLSHPKLAERVVDFDALADFEADDVYCCLGSTIKKAGSREAFRRVDFGYPLALARKAAGARCFLLVSSLGAKAGSPVFYNDVKGQAEAAIAALPLKSFAILRPSLLLGERPEVRLKEKLGEAALKMGGFLLQGPLAKYRAIEASDVAKAMAAIAAAPPSGVRIYESDELRRIASGAIKPPA